jgi:hypothetical protein
VRQAHTIASLLEDQDDDILVTFRPLQPDTSSNNGRTACTEIRRCPIGVGVDHNIHGTLSAPALSLAVSSELDDNQLVVEAATQVFYSIQILHHWTPASLLPGVLAVTEQADRLIGSVQKAQLNNNV